MKILVLNGSPHKKGNTAGLVASFKKGAEQKGHKVDVMDVASMNIGACQACEYCHNMGGGECMQQDDMQGLYEYLQNADMIVLASPVHYWGFSGQLQSAISRFYSMEKPKAKEYALVLSSQSPDVYEGIKYQYSEMLKYFDAEDDGIKCFNGPNQLSKKNLDEMFDFGYCL